MAHIILGPQPVLMFSPDYLVEFSNCRKGTKLGLIGPKPPKFLGAILGLSWPSENQSSNCETWNTG